MTHSFRFALGAAVAATVLGASPGAHAQTATRAALTLDEAVATALTANADAILARLRVDSARGERRIAGALPPLALASIPQSPWQYSVSVPLDVGPQRFYRTHAATGALRAAGADELDTRRLIVFAVRQTFADVLLAETVRDVAREERGMLAQILAAGSARYRAGDVPERDVTKAELELARADAALTRADAQVHAARLSLQLVIGRSDPDTAGGVRGSLAYRAVPVPDSLLALAAQHRPDILAARERAGQSQLLARLASAQLLPVPVASLVYQNGAPFPTGSPWGVGLGVQLPLLYWMSGERERSRAGSAAAAVAVQRTHAQVANEVLTAVDAYRSARSLAERYQGGLLARAASVVETTRYAYQAGAASLLELIDAIRVDAAVRVDDATARHDYWVAVYALCRATAMEFLP